MQKIVTNLWFDGRVEEALDLYTSLLPDSRVLGITRHNEAGMGTPGDIMTAHFELAGQTFTIINGGPHFKHSPAMSLCVSCADQDEVDRLWEGLVSGGGQESRCGWLVDRFGVSWQIVPARLGEMLASDDPAAVERVTAAFMEMSKLDIAELDRAFRGE
ncbi:MAG: VOC family protein [Gemmatimonadetes bacterium]|nr:VOC family protein [Gemmatimonadota bacterium]MYA78629.1 VOC family protein [Gemmatimonadota bacterium]MYG16134.1 VOC family protein [Gemmatimonadota bacterium]MYH18078.1 VOC family protein [Gemmatimonadota bacterium]MYK98911.1 VOC family protein [Gemmatimonadota bacterium]